MLSHWEYKFNFKQYGNDITNIISESNRVKIFNPKTMDIIMKSFGSVFGTKLSARQGIVQDLNRNVMLGTLSHLRRLSYPLPSGSTITGPRKLHNSQWGYVCPTESPDGSNTGIINHLSFLTQVSFTISNEGIYHALLDHGLIPLESIVSDNLSEGCKIIINGTWIGIHNNPDLLHTIMRLLKLNSIIHLYTSLYWDIQKNEYYVFTDAGRMLRPVLVLRKAGPLNSNKLIEGDYSYIECWQRLIRGHMYDVRGEYSIYDDTYYREELQEIKGKYPNFIEFLEDKQSQIEYIDPLETEGLMIAKDIY